MGQKLPKNRSYTPRENVFFRGDTRSSFRTDDEDQFAGFSDARNSFTPVWISLPPFLMMEYFLELSVPTAPSGVVFPFGFLLFWAFYYTFYKPNVLEDRLSDPQQWKFSFPPSLVLGFLLWFVKSSLLEAHYLLWQWPRLRAQKQKELHFEAKLPPKPASQKKEAPKAPPQSVPYYSAQTVAALKVLGIESSNSVTWTEIHKRYRFLAKKLHPDLNGTGTQGRRFIEVDQAYRSLAKQKEIFKDH